MFKNPIKKYQNGGSVNQNQAMQQVVEFISQVAKVSPEEVMATLDKIKGDEDAINALSQALELAKNNDERGFQVIQSMFNPKTNTQFAKDGGKLHDFICKHAKGGYVAGCGCKEDGGKVDNKGYTAQVNAPGDTTRTKQYNYRQEIMQTYPDGSVRYTTRTTGGEPTEIHTWGPEGIPNIWRKLWFGNRQANPETVNNWRDIIANHPEDPRNVLNQENGGEIRNQTVDKISPNFKHTGEITSTKKWGPTDVSLILGNSYNINGEDVVVPTRATEGWLRWNGIDSVQAGAAYNRNGEMVYSPQTWENIHNFYENYLPNSNRVDYPGPTINRKQGGVVKGQNGLYEIPSEAPSTGEIRPDSTTNPIRRWIDRTVDNNSALRTASRYARNFGNSAIGKALGFFMPDPENSLASAPGFKFKMPYVPKYIREMYPNDITGQIESVYNHSVAKPVKMTDDFANEYNRLTGHTGPLLDVLIEKKGGIIKDQNGSVINYYKNKLNNDFFV